VASLAERPRSVSAGVDWRVLAVEEWERANLPAGPFHADSIEWNEAVVARRRFVETLCVDDEPEEFEADLVRRALAEIDAAHALLAPLAAAIDYLPVPSDF
jgi:hypothetical protein